MITINLLPKNLRRVERKAMPVVPYKPALFGVLAVLVLAHAALLGMAAVRGAQLFFLKGAWNRMFSQTEAISSTKGEIQQIEAKMGALKSSTQRALSFTELFSALSGAVPGGMWLERFTFSGDGLVIQGSVVSLNQNEMTIIGKFLQDIKTSPVFGGLFSKIELSSVQRRTVKNFDVVDFVVAGNFKGGVPGK